VIRSGLGAYELMRGVGNLCIGADSDPDYDARRLVELLIAGLRHTETDSGRSEPTPVDSAGQGRDRTDTLDM